MDEAVMAALIAGSFSVVNTGMLAYLNYRAKSISTRVDTNLEKIEKLEGDTLRPQRIVRDNEDRIVGAVPDGDDRDVLEHNAAGRKRHGRRWYERGDTGEL